MYIAMIGNLSEGYKAVGPFEDFDTASTWCDENVKLLDSWIMEIESPS